MNILTIEEINKLKHENKMEGGGGTVEPLLNSHEELRAMVAEAADIIVWMSGSSDFAVEGQAGEVWANSARPKLNKMLDMLRDTAVPA